MKIEVMVKPGSRKGPLIVEQDGGLVVYLREKPHDGEANAALVRMLAEHYGVARGCVAIVGGGKSRKKVVEILKV